MHVLIIEDDAHLGRGLEVAVKRWGDTSEWARDGVAALALAKSVPFDMILLDLGLPRLDGAEVLKALKRDRIDVPVIIITARDTVDERIHGLDLGADDYLTKPFGIGELLARLRVAERHLSGRGNTHDEARIEIGDLAIDLSARRVRRAGADVHLTPIEYQLLATLARHRGKVLTHRQLLRQVWGAAHTESPQYLRIYMRSLRRKIEADPAQPKLLLTEVGVGYRLVDEAA